MVKVFDSRTSISSNVHIHLLFVSFGMDHAWIVRQSEGAQPQGVELEKEQEKLITN
jgi:hypothetical protein